MKVALTDHDTWPSAAAAVVDDGLGAYNDRAAPLHEVRQLACFAHDAQGAVVGGALGRRWGECCELQQLWVAESLGRQGLGTALMRRFEALARDRGCRTLFLETFSFQAPAFYGRLGYAVDHANAAFPHGIVKYHMSRALGDAAEPESA